MLHLRQHLHLCTHLICILRPPPPSRFSNLLVAIYRYCVTGPCVLVLLLALLLAPEQWWNQPSGLVLMMYLNAIS